MTKIILDKVFTPIVYPKRSVRCIAFMASATLIASLVANGIPVKRHPLEPWQYVSPEKAFTRDKLWELLHDYRFKYIATVTFLTSPTGSNQTFTIPGGWNSGNNKIECIGSGGSGGVFAAAQACASGGSGAAYAATTNFVSTPGTNITYQIAATAAAVTGGDSVGNAGNSTWFNGATFGASTVGAVGGGAGQSSSTNVAGVAGGAAASCIGSTKNSGGASGATSVGGSQFSASGGGGAAGLNGNGNASGTATAGTGSTGGSGDAGSGGTGGTGTSNTNGGVGGNGSEYTATGGGTAGSGGGGGGVACNVANLTAGNGGLYGGGGGGIAGDGGTTGTGAQGIIVVTNIPATRGLIVSNIVG